MRVREREKRGSFQMGRHLPPTGCYWFEEGRRHQFAILLLLRYVSRARVPEVELGKFFLSLLVRSEWSIRFGATMGFDWKRGGERQSRAMRPATEEGSAGIGGSSFFSFALTWNKQSGLARMADWWGWKGCIRRYRLINRLDLLRLHHWLLASRAEETTEVEPPRSETGTRTVSLL